MDHHHDDDLTFSIGEVKSLPHTLAETRHLTLGLTEVDPVEGTAVFELHNPEAEGDVTVAGLIEQEVQDVEHANRWRDKLHVPELSVPIDTSTMATATIHVKLHERLRIGDRVWKVEAISAEAVTLRPGHDFEAHTLVNEPEDFGYSTEGIALAERLNVIDEGL